VQLRRINRQLFLNASRVGAPTAARKLADHMWHTTVNLVLRCDLDALPDLRPAQLDVQMVATEPTAFDGFRNELQVTRGADLIEAYARHCMCADGVQTLYVSSTPDGSPIFAQWLISPDDQNVLDQHAPGRYQRLAADEFFVDGAYTFTAHRGKGAMGSGMAQLLRIARDRGARWAITFVAPDNVPSLRGCAAVGFDVGDRRLDIRRLGARSYAFEALDERSRRQWEAALAPRKPA
jgi:hypothetical protein